MKKHLLLLAIVFWIGRSYGQSDSAKAPYLLSATPLSVNTHPSYLFWDRDKNIELFRWHQDSDTLEINFRGIHYLKFDGVIYAFDTVSVFNGHPWIEIYPTYIKTDK